MNIRGVDSHDQDMAAIIVVDHGTRLVIIKDRFGPHPAAVTPEQLISRLRSHRNSKTQCTTRMLFVPVQDVIE